MAKPNQPRPYKLPEYFEDNPLLWLLEEKKQIMKAVRAGKPASSVRMLRRKRPHE